MSEWGWRGGRWPRAFVPCLFVCLQPRFPLPFALFFRLVCVVTDMLCVASNIFALTKTRHGQLRDLAKVKPPTHTRLRFHPGASHRRIPFGIPTDPVVSLLEIWGRPHSCESGYVWVEFFGVAEDRVGQTIHVDHQ